MRVVPHVLPSFATESLLVSYSSPVIRTTPFGSRPRRRRVNAPGYRAKVRLQVCSFQLWGPAREKGRGRGSAFTPRPLLLCKRQYRSQGYALGRYLGFRAFPTNPTRCADTGDTADSGQTPLRSARDLVQQEVAYRKRRLDSRGSPSDVSNCPGDQKPFRVERCAAGDVLAAHLSL